MTWITSVRNALSLVVPIKKETPDTLWHKCKGCGQMIFTRELEENLHVCPKCEHHERVGPRIRFDQMLDEGTCQLLPAPKVPDDPLKFRDSKKYADRIKAPILLIHGGADDNSGTFPIQSERMYAALKGNGATVRYVVLPNEPHGYRALESTEETLWQMTDWLDRHVKPKQAAGEVPAGRK